MNATPWLNTQKIPTIGISSSHVTCGRAPPKTAMMIIRASVGMKLMRFCITVAMGRTARGNGRDCTSGMFWMMDFPPTFMEELKNSMMNTPITK